MRCKLIRIEGMNGNGGRWSCKANSHAYKIAPTVVQIVVASQCQITYCYWLVSWDSLLLSSFNTLFNYFSCCGYVVFLEHRLHSVFCVGHVYFKSGLLQVFGITEFADESHRRGGNGGHGLAGGKGTWG